MVVDADTVALWLSSWLLIILIIIIIIVVVVVILILFWKNLLKLLLLRYRRKVGSYLVMIFCLILLPLLSRILKLLLLTLLNYPQSLLCKLRRINLTYWVSSIWCFPSGSWVIWVIYASAHIICSESWNTIELIVIAHIFLKDWRVYSLFYFSIPSLLLIS